MNKKTVGIEKLWTKKTVGMKNCRHEKTVGMGKLWTKKCGHEKIMNKKTVKIISKNL